jgi:hypothetical protein
MLTLWKNFDNGKLSTADARVHIGFARTVLDSLKVEIAAAHLAIAEVPALEIENGKSKKKTLTLTAA